MTDHPAESHPLDQSHDERHQASLMARRRAWKRLHAQQEPVLEPSHFAPRDDDEAQAEYLREWKAKMLAKQEAKERARQEAREKAKTQKPSHLNWKTAGAVLVAGIAAWQVMQWVGALAYWVGGKL